jgi:hypothetical protein
LEPSRHDRRRVVLRRNGFVCSDGFSNNVAGVEKMTEDEEKELERQIEEIHKELKKKGRGME